MCDIWHVPENVSSAVITASSWCSSFFSSSSNRRQCFILSFSESFVIIHGYINLTFVHTIALCSICYSKKIADGEIIFFFMIEWPPSSGVFCLNIYNQIATEETQAVIWERTEFKHQICHLLDIWPWNKLYYLYFQIITSTS